MATSSNFSTTNQYIVYWIEAIQNSQSIPNNSSSVTVRVWVKRTNTGYRTWGTGTVSVKINGSSYSSSLTPSDSITSKSLKVFERTVPVSHNTNGSKTLTMEAKIVHNSPFSTNWNSWSMNLTTIPRTSKPTVNDSSIYYGSSVTIYTNRASSGFTHTLRYGWNGRTGTIATGVTTSHTWTIPNSFMNYIPSTTESWGTIYCDTYNGSTKIGTETVKVNTYVPSSVRPSLSSVTHSEDVSKVKTLIGSYVQGLSRVNLGISGASGTYGSTIRSYTITFDGSTYNSSSATSGYIKGSGTITITGKVTDSRGRTATRSTSIQVLSYSKPKITKVTAERCNEEGVPDPLGTYLRIYRAGNWSDLGLKNPLTIHIKTREAGSTYWVTKDSSPDTDGSGFWSTKILGVFDITKSYDVRIEAVDGFNTVTSSKVVSTGMVTMSWGKYGIGVGKVWESGALDVGGKISIHSNQWASDGGGLDMNNSDIVKANGIYFNDVADNNGEGLLFLKEGAPQGSTDINDYWNLRVTKDGKLLFNGKVIATAT
jgi:hypothetical protein